MQKKVQGSEDKMEKTEEKETEELGSFMLMVYVSNLYLKAT